MPPTMSVHFLDIRLLTQHVLGMSREDYIKHSPVTLTDEQQNMLDALLVRRAAGEPVAKIIGCKPFWKHEFITNAHTLDPRPDSEWLIEAVLKHVPDTEKPYKFLDCGTGTGCLLLSLLHEYPNATGLGIDQSGNAIEVAERNSEVLGLKKRASFYHLDWTKLDKSLYDIVISNPPYIPTHDIASLMPDVQRYDPVKALDGGSDGLDAYKQLFTLLNTRLKTHGQYICEIGQGQDADIIALGKNAGFVHQDTLHDLAGIARILVFSVQKKQTH